MRLSAVRAARATLQLRVALVCSLLTLIVGAVFAIAVYWQTEQLERDLVETTLRRTLDGVLAGGAPPLSTRLPTGLEYYAADGNRAPAHLRDLSPGMHELDAGQRSFEVLVREVNGVRHIVALDETRNDSRENRIYALALVFIVVVVTIAGLAAYYAAGKALAPLHEFARRVAQLGPESDGGSLQPDYAGTEVGGVAAAFDRYRARLSGFIEREREFTGNASHELRTPLAVIQGAAEVLQMPNLDERRRVNAVARVDHAARQMAEMLHVLLMLAREDSGEGAPDDERCRVEELAAELVEQKREVARGKGIRLELCVEAPVRVSADRTLVAIVIGNLLDNALRYTDAGQVTVTVDSRGFRVSDTGPGLSAGDRALIFERHHRGAASRGAGSGLGLPIARRICDSRGWRIDMESGEGRGTTVFVAFAPAGPRREEGR